MARSDTIGGMFFENARRFGAGRICQLERHKDGWFEYTWADVETIVRELAMGLMELGVAAGDRVAIMAETCPQWSWLDVATAAVRGVLVTTYPTNTAGQMAYILQNSGATVLALSGPAELAKYEEVRENLPDVKHIVVFEDKVDVQEEYIHTLEEVRAIGRASDNARALEERLDSVAADDLLTLIYTSGTTGPPKGVMLTHNNLMSNANAILQLFPLKDDDIALSFLPLSHTLERMAHYTLLRRPIPIAYAEDISRLVQNMQEVRPTVMVAVPRIYEKMYDRIMDSVDSGSGFRKGMFDWAIGVGREVSALSLAGRPIPLALGLQHRLADRLVLATLRERMGGRLRFFISGGAPLAQDLAEFFHAAGVLICEGYGLTETSPVLTANTPDVLRFGTVGKPIPGVELRIAADGEILARGPNVMRGYFGDPEGTAEVLEADGWFHTGDIGEFDPDGFLRITDRKKDIIVTAAGKNVSPQNIESLLLMEKFIEQACVIGDRQRYLTALIVPTFDALRDWAAEGGLPHQSREALVREPEVRALFQKSIDRVNGQLARYEAIRNFALLAEEFAVDNGMLTPTMKVKRKEVMQCKKALLDDLYREPKAS
jgi:long-chain acyl-CoA synthetase